MFQAGQHIGIYKLTKKLAKGGFGEVWLAEKESEFVTKRFAVKLPLDEQVDFEAIRQEAQLWEQASGHPNVLPLIDADVYDGQVAIVSEYVEDGSLDDKLKKIGKFPVLDAVELTIGILNGLDFLHAKNIIHRDVKPQNILLQGNTPRLADFGISRAIYAPQISSVIVGTESYMAPESFEGGRSVQTDIWSVGVLLYKLLTGRTPFPQTNPSEIMYAVLIKEPAPFPEEIPPRLREIVFKALEKDRELDGNSPRRYQSAAAMREDLSSFLENYAQASALPESSPPVLHHTQTEEPTRVKMRIPLPASSNWLDTVKRKEVLPIVGVAFILGIVAIIWLFGKSSVQNSAINSVASNSSAASNSANTNIKTDPAALEYADKAYKLFRQKKYDRAIENYTKAIEISPADFALYNDRGLIYYTRRKYTEAIADFDKSIELKPESLTYNNRGVAYEDKGDRENATADYQKALELDPTNEQANRNLEKLLKP